MNSYWIGARVEGYSEKRLADIVSSFEFGLPPWNVEKLEWEAYDGIMLLEGEIKMDSYEKPDDCILDLAVSLWWGVDGYAPLEITVRPLIRGEGAKTYILDLDDFRKLRSHVAITSSRVKSEQDR